MRSAHDGRHTLPRWQPWKASCGASNLRQDRQSHLPIAPIWLLPAKKQGRAFRRRVTPRPNAPGVIYLPRMPENELEVKWDPILKSESRSDSERSLRALCERSFLSLWSYPSVHHSEGGPGGTIRAKEICDLLVVFGQHLLVFSDKSCAYPDTGDADLDWRRWYRRAILKSAHQVYGAEGWLLERPDRVFLDCRCRQRFPYPLPDKTTARVHRIVVARGSGVRGRRELGGSGSLILEPGIVGEAHLLPVAQGGHRLSVGQVDPRRGFVHVLDDVSLGVLLQTLDTVTDFVAYLERKEAFFLSGRLGMAAGEEDLLAFYLKNMAPDGEHGFVVPTEVQKVLIQDGHWRDFSRRPQRLAQLSADRVSYLWDAVIDRVARETLKGTLYHSTSGFEGSERALRVMASECRTRRRMLAEALLTKLRDTPPTEYGFRTVKPSAPTDPAYVFLLLPIEASETEDEYRRRRLVMLETYCKVAKLRLPGVPGVVGVATETGVDGPRSEDVLYLDCSTWNDEMQQEALELQRTTGFFQEVRLTEGTEHEYPTLAGPRLPDSQRNDPCPCGSGKKYKKCHGVPAKHRQRIIRY
jgi:hypothetical protein